MVNILRIELIVPTSPLKVFGVFIQMILNIVIDRAHEVPYRRQTNFQQVKVTFTDKYIILLLQNHCTGPGVHVDDINKALGVDLPEAEDYDTVGGLVISLIGRIPRIGETVSSSDVEFEVLDADARRVKRLRIARVQKEE